MLQCVTVTLAVRGAPRTDLSIESFEFFDGGSIF